MKTIKLLISIFYTSTLLSQSIPCESKGVVLINTDITNKYYSQDCKEILIQTNNNDIQISSDIYIHKNGKIHIKPTNNQAIKITPFQESSNGGPTGDDDRSKRTKLGSKAGDAKPDLNKTSVTIFPNPVKDILSIKSEENITHYKIIDTFGLIKLESNNIIVQELPQGIYKLFLYTQTQIITKTFIKN